MEAIYENGVLRPLDPLHLDEHQHVTILISEDHTISGDHPGERSHMDTDYLAAARAEVAAMDRIPTLDEVHKITAKDPASWAEAICAEREERF